MQRPWPTSTTLPDYPALAQLMAALWGEDEARGAAVMIGTAFSRFAHRDSPATPMSPLRFELEERMRARLVAPPRQDPLKLAEEFQAAFDRPSLDGFLREAIPDGRWRPGDLHGRLLGLPWADVLTTNWDTLLERASPSDPDRHYEVVRWPADHDTVGGCLDHLTLLGVSERWPIAPPGVSTQLS